MTDTNGGSAFPVLHTIDGNWVKDPLPQFTGMSLRAYFDAQALPAIIRFSHPAQTDYCAKQAVLMADALLREAVPTVPGAL